MKFIFHSNTCLRLRPWGGRDRRFTAGGAWRWAFAQPRRSLARTRLARRIRLRFPRRAWVRLRAAYRPTFSRLRRGRGSAQPINGRRGARDHGEKRRISLHLLEAGTHTWRRMRRARRRPAGGDPRQQMQVGRCRNWRFSSSRLRRPSRPLRRGRCRVMRTRLLEFVAHLATAPAVQATESPCGCGEEPRFRTFHKWRSNRQLRSSARSRGIESATYSFDFAAEIAWHDGSVPHASRTPFAHRRRRPHRRAADHTDAHFIAA